MVTDPGNFSAQGEGLGLVRVNQTASFNVCAPCAQCQDLGVCIIGRFHEHLYSQTDRETGNTQKIERSTTVGEKQCDKEKIRN